MPENAAFQLIDRTAHAKHMARARMLAVEGSEFLLRHTLEDMVERLSSVNRVFDNAVFIGAVEGVKYLANVPSIKSLNVVDLEGKQERLALEAGAHDLILSPLELQFSNDMPGVLAQIRRALKPDGLFLGAMVGGSTLHELRSSLLEAEANLGDNIHARILPFADVRDVGGLLQRVGLALPVSDVDTLTVRYDNMFALMQDLRAMGGVNCLSDRQKSWTARSVFIRAAEIYAEKFSDADGRIRATFQIVSMSGWAPHESQQKPLKPGSAEVSLSEVL